MGLSNGTTTSVLAKLDRLEAKLKDANERNDTTVRNQLGAFINNVEALPANKIDDEDADFLIDAAEAILEML